MKSSPSPHTKNRKEEARTLEKVRSDLNLEKWSIWQPSNSRSKKTRTLSREITTSTGDKLVSEVTIGYVDKIGTITTEDQKTCYALIKIWEENGKPLEETFFSLRRLAKILNKKWGTNVIQATTNSLTRLRTVPLILNNAYYDSTSKETLESLETFNILEDLKIVKKKRDGHITHEGGYFKLNDFIIKNILNRHSKPVLLNTVLNFRSEIAQLMYTHADLILFRRNRYERRTQELFFDTVARLLNSVWTGQPLPFILPLLTIFHRSQRCMDRVVTCQTPPRALSMFMTFHNLNSKVITVT